MCSKEQLEQWFEEFKQSDLYSTDADFKLTTGAEQFLIFVLSKIK